MSDNQVSETSKLTPQPGDDDTPAIDEAAPSAEDTQHVAQGHPRDYSSDREEPTDREKESRPKHIP